jgi:hypothetical protein
MNGERDRSVQADHCQKHRRGCEEADQLRAKSQVADGVGNHLVHRSRRRYLYHRIECVKARAPPH